MQNQAAVTSVYISGEFNGYNTTANPLTNISGTLWSATLPLEEGRSYSYKFVKNASGDYEDNIASGACNPGGLGGNNRNYTVTTAPSQTVASSCFSSCGRLRCFEHRYALRRHARPNRYQWRRPVRQL